MKIYHLTNVMKYRRKLEKKMKKSIHFGGICGTENFDFEGYARKIQKWRWVGT